MNGRIFNLLACLAMAAPQLALAQETEPPITVTGSRGEPPSTTQSVRAIAAQTDGSLARFESAVCPAVGGLPVTLATTVVRLMRRAVQTAGVDLAPEECSPNLTLLVTDDGNALIEQLSLRRPELFATLDARDRAGLKDDSGPVWSWHATAPRRADGAPVGRDGGGGSQTYVVQGARMSRLGSPVRQDMENAFVVLNVAASDGHTLQQLADFAVMRGLAQTRRPPPDKLGSASILQLFDDAAPVAGMTDFDREFLAALYRGGNGFTYAQKTRQIAQEVDAMERYRDAEADR